MSNALQKAGDAVIGNVGSLIKRVLERRIDGTDDYYRTERVPDFQNRLL